MWVLSTSSTRRWLRPGNKYIVGRASRSDQPADIVLKEPSISRHHLSIEVKGIEPTASGHLNVRPVVHLADLDSRFGSSLDSSPLKQANLPQRDGPVHITVGTVTVLTITWEPLVIASTEGPSSLDPRTFEITKVVNYLEPKLSLLVCPAMGLSSKNDMLAVAYCLAAQKPVVSPDYVDALCKTADALEKDLLQLPDPQAYLVKPEYAPNSKRSHCLEGQSFWTDSKDLYEGIAATVKAASGSINGISEPHKAGMLVIEGALSQEPTVELSELLLAIEQSRPVLPKPGSRKRPRQVRMLDFMTQDSQIPESQSALQDTPPVPEQPSQYTPSTASQSRRKRVAKLPRTFLDIAIKEEPEAGPSAAGPVMVPAPESEQPLLAPETVPESPQPSNDAPSEAPSEAPSQALSQAPSQAPSQKRKRVAPIANPLFGDGFSSSPQVSPLVSRPKSASGPTTVEAPPPVERKVPKKKKPSSAFDIVPEFAVQSDGPSQDEDMSMPSTPEIQNLVLVEACVPIIAAQEPIEPARTEWSGMPNFKAFKRKAVEQPMEMSLVQDDQSELDQQWQKDEQLFVDEPERDSDIDPELDRFDNIRRNVAMPDQGSDDEFSFHFS